MITIYSDCSEPGTTTEFNKWVDWKDNAIRILDLIEQRRGDNSNIDLDAENKRITLILKSMEVVAGVDYIRTTWEIRFVDDLLYGIFVLKF